MINNFLKEKYIQFSEENLVDCLKILTPVSLSQDKFKKSIYLLIKELHDLNNSKYKVLMHIAEKAFNESDYHIYTINYSDFRNELRLYI